MINSLKAEWRKLIRRPAIWWLGAFILAIVPLVYTFSWIQYNSPSFHPDSGATLAQLKAQLYPANFAATMVAGLSFIGGALMLVMGALAVGSEYGWTTFKTVYTQRPGRLQVLAGQLAAVSAISVIIVAGAFLLAALSSFTIANLAGAAIVWPALTEIVKALAATWLILEVWLLFGMVMAYLFRQSALAIGLGLAYMLAIEGILFRALSGFHLSWVTTVEKFMVGQNTGALSGSFQSGFRGPTPLISAEHALLVVVAYALGFVILSGILVRSRDVV
ncbi:MAG TPA: ABC transporter permease subunit [Candidatus Dormibacteraeota bacterium]|nr:ABC transporter permease subunit [Candidatus Dormibacteraeota bacterium]